MNNLQKQIHTVETLVSAFRIADTLLTELGGNVTAREKLLTGVTELQRVYVQVTTGVFLEDPSLLEGIIDGVFLRLGIDDLVETVSPEELIKSIEVTNLDLNYYYLTTQLKQFLTALTELLEVHPDAPKSQIISIRNILEQLESDVPIDKVVLAPIDSSPTEESNSIIIDESAPADSIEEELGVEPPTGGKKIKRKKVLTAKAD